MKIVIEPGSSGNCIATIAIGEKYLINFYRYAYPSWRKYCEKYNLGLIVFDKNLIEESNLFWKKANWQKLLIGKKIVESKLEVCNICHLDTDIIISPLATNIFEFHEEDNISVISQINNLPFPDNEVRKRVAFLRNKYIDSRYPLDSSLFATPKQIFEYHQQEPQEDYFCSGVFIFNVELYYIKMESWFNKYPKNIDTITGGGEEPILNYEFQANKNIKFLDYKFQALWLYEMAWKYPFLYRNTSNIELIKNCVQTSLLENNFLHFCGSWAESDMFYLEGIATDYIFCEMANNLKEYIELPSTGRPVGLIKPI
jgi:hypothetical protein